MTDLLTAIEPLPFFTSRLHDVLHVSTQSSEFGLKTLRFERRRATSHMRRCMPWRLKKTSKPKTSPVVRKARARLVDPTRCLPASHKWAAKRMKMSENEWWGESTICVAEEFKSKLNPQAVVNMAEKFVVVHDSSYEKWIEVRAGDGEAVKMCLQRVFDCVPGDSEVTGTKFVLHECDAFPMGALGPVRVVKTNGDGQEVRLRFAVHAFFFEQAWKALQMACKNQSVELKRLDSYYTFLVIGKMKDAALKRFDSLLVQQDSKPVIPAQVLIRNPLTNQSFLSKASFEEYFFGGGLDADLSSGKSLFSNVSPAPPTSNHKSFGVFTECFDFDFGIKQATRLPARLVVVNSTPEEAKHVWLALAEACRGNSAGWKDMELLHTSTCVPYFPREYPDTKAGTSYWSAVQKNFNKQQNKRPMGKQSPNRGVVCDFRKDLKISNEEALLVARGWEHVEYFFNPETETEDIPVGLMLRIFLVAPHLSKFGIRPSAPRCIVCEPTQADYEGFVRAQGKKTESRWVPPNSERKVIGVTTASRLVANDSFAFGFIRAADFVDLLKNANDFGCKYNKRRLFVLVKNTVSNLWGVAFLSVTC